MVRIELTAEDSLAAMRARSKLGIAMAAMIRMIATTINNSINEKPFCFRFIITLSSYFTQHFKSLSSQDFLPKAATRPVGAFCQKRKSSLFDSTATRGSLGKSREKLPLYRRQPHWIDR